MKYSVHFLLSLITLLLGKEQLHAQFSNLRFDKYTVANGLSDNNTNAIIQDSRGFLWIGSNNGLSRFDGRFFKKYTHLGEDGLTDLSIVCLAEDKLGNIWIGTQNGLNKLDPQTEKITHYYEGTGMGTIPFKWCNYLYTDRNNELWLTTEKGLALYHMESDSFENFPIAVTGMDNRINKFISRILEDNKGRLWLTTSYGIKLFDRKTHSISSFLYDLGAEKSAYPVVSIIEDSKEDIWIGTWEQGFLKFNETNDIFEQQSFSPLNFKQLVVSDMLTRNILNREYLLLATNKGLIFLDGSGKSPAKFTSLTDNISHLFPDRQGNLWITGSSGLYRMNNNSLSFEWTVINDPDPEWKHIYHVIPDIGNSSRYFLSTLKGWWQYDVLSHQLNKFKLPSDPENLLGGINTWTANEKGYWFSSINGLGYYDRFNNRLDSWTSLAQLKSGQTSTGIIAADKSNKLWVSLHRSGILVFGPDGVNPTLLFADRNKPDNLTGKDIHDIQLIDDGSICFTADNRLFKINASDYSYTSFSPEIKDERIDRNKIAPEKIFFSPGHSVFVSSSLQIYEFRQNRLIKVFPEEGYAEFIIGKIDCDNRGNIWALTSRGLLKTDTTFRHWVNISIKLGWKEDEEIEDFHLGPGGEVILAANGKFGILHDSLLSRSFAPPAVLISKVKHGDRVSYMVIGQPTPIKCSYKEAVEIELSSMNFTEDKETRILYMLEGWENKWNELSGQQLIRYEQLPPGDYTFLTRQVNDEGIESEITSLKFSIPPPFYRSWWFIALILLAAAATHFSINHYRKRKALELERLRTRIAIDLHDDIGATLSSISIYSDALKRQLKDSQPMLVNVLDKMGESSREMVSGMSDIVWAINPDNDHGEKLISRMQNFATDVCAMKNIHLHFQDDERINSIVFPLEGRKNFYLVFKEAVNNAVKYSEAANLWISLQLQDRKLKLQVRDDGRGFNENTIRRGNGLKNMKSRADEMKADLQIVSTPDEGTTILLYWNI